MPLRYDIPQDLHRIDGGREKGVRSEGSTGTGAFMLSINWRRGLFRLWIAASFVWLIIAGAFVQEGIRRDVSTLMTDRSAELRPVTDPALTPPADAELSVVDELLSGKSAIRSEFADLRARILAGTEDTRTPSQRAQDELTISASVLLLPPILTFALGWAGLWILRGFRS